jgi:DNA polymerase-3 subunit alpha
VPEYVERAKADGQEALAITDHGNLCGLPEFYKECRKADIEPILGEEFYFTIDAERHRLETKGKSTKHEEMAEAESEGLGRYHVVILARGQRGYETLCELSTATHHNFYGKPLLDRNIVNELSDKDRDSLVCLSGCATSVISRAVLAGDMQGAARHLIWWREMFPHFYIELQHHDTDFDREINRGLLRLAKRYEVPIVVTNDPHYAVPEDHEHHDALLAIQTASDIDDPERFAFSGSGYHLRTEREMREAFSRYGSEVWKPGILNTQVVAKLCHTRIKDWESKTWHIPKFPDVEDSQAFLQKLTIKGLKELGRFSDREYVKRAKYELGVFEEVGIADFLLITWDIIEEARRLGIGVGPGRGSVCGTLVGQTIRLHKIDPIKYELRFDRFLNPARPKMPDIDTDFSQERREELFPYIIRKYGAENVVTVCAYQTLRLKSAFQSMARAYGIEWNERQKLTKLLANDDENSIDLLPDELREAHPELASRMLRLSGTKKGVSQHPAGVIIADPKDRIAKMVPEMWIASSKRMVGQYDLLAAEAMHLLKQDLLGLRTIDTIEHSVDLIEQSTGEVLDPDSWVPDDEPGDDKVWEMLAEGRTGGVFQMEGPANQQGCREVQPNCFEDVVSITALYRTGAMSAGFPKVFNENRRKGTIDFIHPDLEPILGHTSGVVLYQEQVMDMGEFLAGFDMVQVDDIKDAIKKKDPKVFAIISPLFIRGCMEHSGMSESVAKEIWRYIEGYAGYGYNRSHAVAYTMLTYQTARLKALYPLEFLTALLRTVKGSSKEAKAKREGYMRELMEYGYTMLTPCINRSDELATPDVEHEGVRFGLSDIAGVGHKAASKIVDGRPEGGYTSVKTLMAVANNTGTMDHLHDACALEVLGAPGDLNVAEEKLNWQFVDRMATYREKYALKVRLPVENKNDKCLIIGEIRKITRGTTKGNKPYVTWHLQWDITHTYDIRLWSGTDSLWKLNEGSVVAVQGEWEPTWHNLSVGRSKQVKIIKAI